ncbi:uncharacterized protein LOC142227678 [Haematobia irritans]|uniref:uncharacterized protein LOC142227678 n=1 Tax=Haematobia irritans TaxID=7368 RepID=UPI003F50684F
MPHFSVTLEVSKTKEIPRPLSTYKFHLDDITRGQSKFNTSDIPIVFKCTPDKLVNLCATLVDRLPLPSVYEWNIEDICKWLRAYGYPQYENTFRENLINGRTLLLLDASSLTAMNIKIFDHIKHLTYGIRSLFYFEMTKFGRSISLYPEFHNELYKLYRTRNGGNYDNVRRSDLWRKFQLIRKREPNHSHWEILEKWLGFEKDAEFPERIGAIHRYSLYRCKNNSRTFSQGSQPCLCTPGCECCWTDTNRRPPWAFQCLPHMEVNKDSLRKCQSCISPYACRWTSKRYLEHDILSRLQTAFPQRYGLLLSHCGKAHEWTDRYETVQAYRLSLL